MATMGVARRLAGISKWEFIDSLGERKIDWLSWIVKRLFFRKL